MAGLSWLFWRGMTHAFFWGMDRATNQEGRTLDKKLVKASGDGSPNFSFTDLSTGASVYFHSVTEAHKLAAVLENEHGRDWRIEAHRRTA